jgi:hypothetical protein
VASGAVSFDGELTIVTTGDHEHRVGIAADGTQFCTCRWWGRYRGSRGDCAHVLAAGLARGSG